MRYVTGGARENGCLFCNRLEAGDDDEASLILHRGDRAFIIMNLFPYSTGHVMIVPNDHVATPEDLDSETTNAMAGLRAPLLRALRRVLTPDGFNLGLNIGAAAGAGVTDHLHEHVVPRWLGDANFMPVTAGTTVMPELVAVTYAKLRPEIARELEGSLACAALILSREGGLVLFDEEGRLPAIAAIAGEPLWKTVGREAERLGAIRPEVAGWTDTTIATAGVGAVVLTTDLLEGNGLHGLGQIRHLDQIADPDLQAWIKERSDQTRR